MFSTDRGRSATLISLISSETNIGDGYGSFFRARCVISFSAEMILSTEGLGDRLATAGASTQIVPIGVGGNSVSLEVRPMGRINDGLYDE
jgi:hypothetical protein